MVVSAAAFVLCRTQLPALYTTDAHVIAAAAAVLPIAAIFQVFDGVQVVGGGVLRGDGNTRPAAWFNFVGYYVLAIPFAYLMAFRLDGSGGHLVGTGAGAGHRGHMPDAVHPRARAGPRARPGRVSRVGRGPVNRVSVSALSDSLTGWNS